MENKKEKRDFWGVMWGGTVVCTSTVPFLGYPSHILLDMHANGYSFYKNGKRVSKCQLALA